VQKERSSRPLKQPQRREWNALKRERNKQSLGEGVKARDGEGSRILRMPTAVNESMLRQDSLRGRRTRGVVVGWCLRSVEFFTARFHIQSKSFIFVDARPFLRCSSLGVGVVSRRTSLRGVMKGEFKMCPPASCASRRRARMRCQPSSAFGFLDLLGRREEIPRDES